MSVKHFNIRVYGILSFENRVLVADEVIKGHAISKLPGGGLEFGEGTIDCLIREFKEETGAELKSWQHFYTTDFFQVSAFNSEHQVISIYYLAKAVDAGKIPVGQTFNESAPNEMDTFTLRWLEMSKLSERSFHLPIDKKVAVLLNQHWREFPDWYEN